MLCYYIFILWSPFISYRTLWCIFGQPLIPQPQVVKPQVYEKLVFTACKNPTVTKHVW